MSKLFDQLVSIRGLDDLFLHPKYEDCLNPSLLPDIEPALSRMRTAITMGEKCLIYGDYDVDGVTASATLYHALKLAGFAEVEIMLPNRFEDGYGMSNKVVQKAVSDRVKLVFTVDCGSRNHEIIAELSRHGIDTIVTDHHECGATLPKAIAVINPKRQDVKVDSKLRELAGVGVVFKLAQALMRAGFIPEGQEKWLLDLVAIGTICDSMKLTGENRLLCRYGLLVLEKTRRPGLKELMRNAGIKDLSGDAIGYQIGPRLNAAGRMESAEKALQLLMAEQRANAASLASDLEKLNTERKHQQNMAVKEIEKRGLSDDPVIIEQGQWHEGVLGIIAGRLVENYKKPAFVLSEADGCIKGSGRSFGEFNLAEALDACREYLISGGGHAEACGVKIAVDKFSSFKRAMNSYYNSLNLNNQERFLSVQEDLIVKNFEDLSLELIDELRTLEPFGNGNQVPIFRMQDTKIMDVAHLGSDGQHLRLTLWDQGGHAFKAIGFSVPERYLNLRTGDTIDIWITLEENIFRGIRSVEGRIVKIAW